MSTIIDFLRDDLSKQSTSEEINVSKHDIDSLKSLFEKQNIPKQHISQKDIRPRINQVWAVKDEYFDFLGNKQATSHPILVSLLTDTDSFEEEDLVRVAVVSPFIEMATQLDDVCKDVSIIGFPFLVENWNDQPILTEILDEYIGYYEPKEISNNKESLSTVQKQFREIEISRAKFLNNSISALIGFVEMNQNNEFGAVISVSGQTIFGACPKADDEFASNEPTIEIPETEDGVFSKSGVVKKSKSILFQDERLPFDIQVKKNEDGFILSVFTTDNLELFDSRNKKNSPASNNERLVFHALKKGLYTLESNNIHEPIKIRVK